jgi:hypothetical protein
MDTYYFSARRNDGEFAAPTAEAVLVLTGLKMPEGFTMFDLQFTCGSP